MVEVSGATETFAGRVRREIAARRVLFPSERQFALRIGWTPTYLSRVLNDPDWRPEQETIVRLAEGFGIPPSEVESWIPKLYGEEVPNDSAQDDPLASLQRKMALERPDVRAKLAQLKVKYADRPHVYEAMERRILRAWGTNIDGIADTALDDA